MNVTAMLGLGLALAGQHAKTPAVQQDAPQRLVKLMQAIDSELKLHRADIPWLKAHYRDDSYKIVDGWPTIECFGENDRTRQRPEQLSLGFYDITPGPNSKPGKMAQMAPPFDFNRPECMFPKLNKRLNGLMIIYSSDRQVRRIHDLILRQCQRPAVPPKA